MKEITLEQLASEAPAVIDAAQRERLVVTRDGRPVALVVGIEFKDEEDLRLEADPEFWRMIDERRREATIPWEQAKAELLSEED
jgi:antitoxin (DNA-binding transcriptional repressor) of toxin-antitoxin stability system